MDIVILTYTLLEENAYRIATLLEQNAYVPNPREQECIRENKKKWEEESRKKEERMGDTQHDHSYSTK
ncbi:hypothetical protein RclHR1_02480017 [Rhizophagus clarus]|uniref:Uncharacterized protein n=1 Tax=Rhizophagus clarus TaxID=94130 RepID=A0A2Z6RT54_9GLOM|nr:hypothetical protein RclHR1_02480017 [Rhizophagus clarus]